MEASSMYGFYRLLAFFNGNYDKSFRKTLQ